MGYSVSLESLAEEAQKNDFYNAYEIAAKLSELAGQPDEAVTILESGIYSWPLAIDGRVANMALEAARLAAKLSQYARAAEILDLATEKLQRLRAHPDVQRMRSDLAAYRENMEEIDI